MKKKILFSFLLILLLIFSSFPAYAQDFDTIAEYAALMEVSTGQFLFVKNADEPRPPASITKIMTLLLAFEALERGDINWDTKTIVSEKAWRTGGSSMFLEVDTEVTVEELINGIVIVSANDGCIAIAELLAGSEEAFVQRMNKRAAELGLTQTHFQNSTGLHAENHHMSARDIAVLARELITKHPRILEIAQKKEYTYNNIKQQNLNPLIGRFSGADGLKTGSTPESGYSLVGTAVQNNMRLISVALNTADKAQRLLASQELLNYGFHNFEFAKTIKKGETIGEIPVKDGKQKSAALTVAEDLPVLAPKGRQEDLEFVVAEEKQLTAPVEEGTQAATLLVQLDGETIVSAPLVTAEQVSRANIFIRFFRSIINFIRSLIGRF
ncbi:MAG: D-alanyl-D-alanine carboxypeptidase [Firmicutes bacterium]|nr:D-alanyl-D-alanine carboxypeptidase [Bacillota bacterium]